MRQEELTKLARVRIDITNRLDHLWSLDIKKSTAYPPDALRSGLKQIINRITEGNRQGDRHRFPPACFGIDRRHRRIVRRRFSEFLILLAFLMTASG